MSSIKKEDREKHGEYTFAIIYDTFNKHLENIIENNMKSKRLKLLKYFYIIRLFCAWITIISLFLSYWYIENPIVLYIYTILLIVITLLVRRYEHPDILFISLKTKKNYREYYEKALELSKEKKVDKKVYDSTLERRKKYGLSDNPIVQLKVGMNSSGKCDYIVEREITTPKQALKLHREKKLGFKYTLFFAELILFILATVFIYKYQVGGSLYRIILLLNIVAILYKVLVLVRILMLNEYFYTKNGGLYLHNFVEGGDREYGRGMHNVMLSRMFDNNLSLEMILYLYRLNTENDILIVDDEINEIIHDIVQTIFSTARNNNKVLERIVDELVCCMNFNAFSSFAKYDVCESDLDFDKSIEVYLSNIGFYNEKYEIIDGKHSNHELLDLRKYRFFSQYYGNYTMTIANEKRAMQGHSLREAPIYIVGYGIVSTNISRKIYLELLYPYRRNATSRFPYVNEDRYNKWLQPKFKFDEDKKYFLPYIPMYYDTARVFSFTGISTSAFYEIFENDKRYKYYPTYNMITSNEIGSMEELIVDNGVYRSNKVEDQLYYMNKLVVNERVYEIISEYVNSEKIRVIIEDNSYDYYICEVKIVDETSLDVNMSIFVEEYTSVLVRGCKLIYPCLNADIATNLGMFKVKYCSVEKFIIKRIAHDQIFISRELFEKLNKFNLRMVSLDRSYTLEREKLSKTVKPKSISINIEEIDNRAKEINYGKFEVMPSKIIGNKFYSNAYFKEFPFSCGYHKPIKRNSLKVKLGKNYVSSAYYDIDTNKVSQMIGKGDWEKPRYLNSYEDYEVIDDEIRFGILGDSINFEIPINNKREYIKLEKMYLDTSFSIVRTKVNLQKFLEEDYTKMLHGMYEYKYELNKIFQEGRLK